MILEPMCMAASANLIDTYINLGEAIPGTISETGPGFRACLGLFPHPVCNFAACVSIDEGGARQLARTAASRPGFQVYSLPMDATQSVEPLLFGAGFQRTYSLVQMVSQPKTTDDPAHVVQAITASARLRVSRFMSEQFFSRQTASFRVRISEATARASRLELWCVTDGPTIGGSLMLCRQPGMVGVYNLCVREDLRRSGMGSGMMRWVLAEAMRDASHVTLQCDERLKDWYGARGFAITGAVSVYSLDKSAANDIMFRD